MTSPLMDAKIHGELVPLLQAVLKPGSATLVEDLTRLDAALERVRADLHPQLVHFLERRSYAKALMFLTGQSDIPAGICGGRAGKV
jgi:hypothetical protein